MQALEGIKIIDLTWQGPGPFCTWILGDLGADVLKIQAPPAAGARQVLRELSTRDLAHRATDRNKKSLLLNLKTEAGQGIFQELARDADVIVEGFRPGVAERLGIDYPTITKINPKVIYCAITGYGQDGPYRGLPGHDINYISFAGALGLIGEAGRQPAIPLNLLADFGAGGMSAVIGILSALTALRKTGRGQYVDISLTDTVMSLLAPGLWDSYLPSGIVPKRGETALGGGYPYYNVYETRDGQYISFGCLEPWLWDNLCQAIDKEELMSYHTEPEHRQYKSADKKWDEVTGNLRQLFLTKTRDEWFDLLSQHDIPIGKVYSVDEVVDDPQVQQRQMVIDVEHPTEGRIKQVGIAIKLSDTPGQVRSLAPALGEHTEYILRERLGLSKPEIERLDRENIIELQPQPKK